MNGREHGRPDPDLLLRNLQAEEGSKRGKLKIFFGMCAGVGKTYAMLEEAHNNRTKGKDIVIGYVETHKRPETEALLRDIPVIPRKTIDYRGTTLQEMDLDAILFRKPEIALVDELAHTNAPGSRHVKRYQDVIELLDNGIDVFTTVNVQHLESRADTVGQITGSVTRETVPDSIFDQADEVKLIDLPPEELLKRLSEGRVYTSDRTRDAIANFFQKGHLTALREMSLRMTAERVDHQLRDYLQSKQIEGPWKSGQRLVVGISSSPESVKLIRWARRMAYTMSATWVALYVETSSTLPKNAREQLGKNLKLARELGAEVITTSDQDLVQALLRVARQEQATQILLGKSQRNPLLFWKESLLDRLVRHSEGLDVYIVGGSEDRPRRVSFTAPQFRSKAINYIVAACIVVAVVIACRILGSVAGYQTVALILLFTVSLLPLRFGFGPVLLAATISALLWDYLFIPPLYTFSIGRIEDRLMLATYFLIAIITGILTTRSRSQERAVRAREERAVALYTLTKELSQATTQSDVMLAAVVNLKKFFGADVIVYPGEPDGDLSAVAVPESTFSINEKEFGVVAWVYWNEKNAGKNTETLPFAQATYYPLSGPRYTLGVIGVRFSTDEKLTTDAQNLLENFIRQISLTLDREMLHEVTRNAIVIQESERLYKTLFSSISHELRTPIASILSASEGLQDSEVSSRKDIRNELAGQIQTAATRLNRLVGNLLNMTRLESGLIKPVPDWTDLGDLLNSTLNSVANEMDGRQISTTIDPNVPLLKVDYGLIEQVFVNLLHNIAQYTPAGSPIEISATLSDGNCVIRFDDHGPGLSKEALSRIFDKFYRVPGSQVGGTGLGLSIAKGFIEAHHGTLRAESPREGGTRFIIEMPLAPQPIPNAAIDDPHRE